MVLAVEFVAFAANIVFQELIHQSEEQLGKLDMLIWLPQFHESCAERGEAGSTGQSECRHVAERQLLRDLAPQFERAFDEDAFLLR